MVELIANTQSLGWFVIEVKLDSGKSGVTSNEDDEGKDEGVSPDQLHKYWQGLRVQFGGKRLGVVYLTSDIVPPVEELAASLARESSDWLGWLSWRNVWAEMRKRDELAASDLADILAAKGLKGFDGFHAKLPTTLPSSGRFWASPQRNWFRIAPRNVANTPHFWSDKKEQQ